MTSIGNQLPNASELLHALFGTNPPQKGITMDQLAPEIYSRKTFDVEAVLVTDTNLDAIASWTGGQVLAHAATETEPAKFFVKVPVKRPLNEKQTHAYVGDWVLKARSGFKVYTEKAMQGCFEPKRQPAAPTHVEN